MRTMRVIAVFSIMAAAACVSSVERTEVAVPDSAAQATHEIIAALHAAIPASATAGEAFEYAAEVPVPAENLAVVDTRQFFEYN